MTESPSTEEGIEVTVAPDGDGTAELSATVFCSGFRGHGSAWFAEDQIRAFATSLEQYPLRQGENPRIQGGYWSDVGDSLEQLHLSITVYPINARGQLAARVVLADPPLSRDDRADSLNRAEVEVPTTYDYLSQFARQLKSFTRYQPVRAFLKASTLA